MSEYDEIEHDPIKRLKYEIDKEKSQSMDLNDSRNLREIKDLLVDILKELKQVNGNIIDVECSVDLIRKYI